MYMLSGMRRMNEWRVSERCKRWWTCERKRWNSLFVFCGRVIRVAKGTITAEAAVQCHQQRVGTQQTQIKTRPGQSMRSDRAWNWGVGAEGSKRRRQRHEDIDDDRVKSTIAFLQINRASERTTDPYWTVMAFSWSCASTLNRSFSKCYNQPRCCCSFDCSSFLVPSLCKFFVFYSSFFSFFVVVTQIITHVDAHVYRTRKEMERCMCAFLYVYVYVCSCERTDCENYLDEFVCFSREMKKSDFGAVAIVLDLRRHCCWPPPPPPWSKQQQQPINK